MVVARVSGTLMVSSLKQNKFGRNLVKKLALFYWSLLGAPEPRHPSKGSFDKGAKLTHRMDKDALRHLAAKPTPPRVIREAVRNLCPGIRVHCGRGYGSPGGKFGGDFARVEFRLWRV